MVTKAMTIYEKLAQVHAVMRQPVKDSKNPHFNSTFASLNECNRVVADAVREVGECDYWQRATFNEKAGSWEMQTVFCADGQETVLSSFPFFSDPNPQKAASASTYARRYSLVSAFNLAAEDDDGNGAAGKPTDFKLKAAKARMWQAIQKYAELHGRTPEEILEGVKKRPEWAETADFFEGVAIEFEGEIHG